MSGIEDEFYQAVTNGDIETIIELLKKGGSANTLVQSGQTILGLAVQFGRSPIIRTLLEAEKYFPPEEEALKTASTSKETCLELDSYLAPSWFQWEQQTEQNPMEDPRFSSSRLQTDPPLPSQWELRLFRSLRQLTTYTRKCDVNLADYYDRMPVHYAAESGNPEVLELLLASGCRVNVSDSKNLTPLHFAVEKGHKQVTEMLLKAGSRVNSKNSDRSSALHLASSRGFLQIVEQLVDYGAKLDILDSSDRTPLFLAVCRSHQKVVQYLLMKGAKVNMEEIHGYTPLSEAVFQKDTEMVHLLLKSGAKITPCHHLLHFSVFHRLYDITHQFLSIGATVNLQDDCGDSPLHVAVRSAQTRTLDALLKAGGNVHVRNVLSGQSLLHEVVDGVHEEHFSDFCAILQTLIANGIQLNAESFTPGDTPLYRAILLDKYRFAGELVRHGCDVHCGFVYSCNIDNLCLALRKNHPEMVRLLVYAGFHLGRSHWQDFVPAPSVPVAQWLVHAKSNPMKLLDRCRVSVRACLGQNLILKLHSLSLPDRVTKFLLFEDFLSSPQGSAEDKLLADDASNANFDSF